MSYKSHLFIFLNVEECVNFRICLSDTTGQDCAQNFIDWRRQGCEANYDLQLLDLASFQSV